ncbi:hypothetical protein NHP164001_18120 [Helicobacter trogontum]|uniref:Uncharacterized protein n=1 Tax=Helicobacter trogontum TaxID=50960 RepID=A0ABQ0D631_9HELI
MQQKDIMHHDFDSLFHIYLIYLKFCCQKLLGIYKFAYNLLLKILFYKIIDFAIHAACETLLLG